MEEFKSPDDFVKWYRERLPAPVALRIAAIRETFEECGILLVRSNVVQEAQKLVGRESKMGQGYCSGE